MAMSIIDYDQDKAYIPRIKWNEQSKENRWFGNTSYMQQKENTDDPEKWKINNQNETLYML